MEVEGEDLIKSNLDDGVDVREAISLMVTFKQSPER